MNRVRAHRRQRVDLLGDAHRADLGRDRAADPAGQHRRGQHRPKLAAHRQIDQRAQSRFKTELPELRIRLHGQHHADERARERDDRQAEHANVVERRDQRIAARQPLTSHERVRHMNSAMSPSVSTQRITTAPTSAIESATALIGPRRRRQSKYCRKL